MCSLAALDRNLRADLAASCSSSILRRFIASSYTQLERLLTHPLSCLAGRELVYADLFCILFGIENDLRSITHCCENNALTHHLSEVGSLLVALSYVTA